MPQSSAALPARADGLPTISVVIPAYNEARIIEACLRALTEPEQPVDEIIVIDNASTDGTAEVVAKFGGVRLIREERRGITYARTTGFDAVAGDIIARIDADTIVGPNWADTIRRTLHLYTDVDALAGGAAIAELSPGRKFWCRFWYRNFRHWHERSIGVSPMIYGFNGAMRRSAWLKCRDLVAMNDERVSEDVDVTIALLRTGHCIKFVPGLVVKARLFRSLDVTKLRRYYRTDSLTLARHRFGNEKRWAEGSRERA